MIHRGGLIRSRFHGPAIGLEAGKQVQFSVLFSVRSSSIKAVVQYVILKYELYKWVLLDFLSPLSSFHFVFLLFPDLSSIMLK